MYFHTYRRTSSLYSSIPIPIRTLQRKHKTNNEFVTKSEKKVTTTIFGYYFISCWVKQYVPQSDRFSGTSRIQKSPVFFPEMSKNFWQTHLQAGGVF